MADQAAVAPPRPRKRRWLRILGWIVIVLVVLLVVAYFVGTSSAFVKGVILPRVSKSLNADVTVSDAAVHPFSQITLRNLKVQAAGQPPIVTAPEVRLRYSLLDMIRGHIRIDEITLDSPAILNRVNPDGTSNLDPLLKAQKKAPENKPPPQPSKPSSSPQIDLRKLALNNASIRYEKIYSTANSDAIGISNINLTIENVKNGQTGKLALSSDISIVQNPPAPGTNGLAQAALRGTFNFDLSPDLKPSSVQGNLQLGISRAEGGLAPLAAFATKLDCDLTPKEIKQVALTFLRNNEPLGALIASGPFDSEKTEGRLNVELRSIDKRLLNMIGAAQGIDFGGSTVSSKNEIDLANGGSLITVAGRFSADKVQVTRAGQAAPTLDVGADYRVGVDRSKQNAVIQALSVAGKQNGVPFLKTELTSPMTIAWGGAAGAVGDSTLKIVVTNFNLADWKPFLGDTVTAGTVGANAQLLSQQGGKKLAFDLDSRVAGLAAATGTNRVSDVTVELEAHGQAADFKQFDLKQYRFNLSLRNEALVALSGAGTYDLATAGADQQIELQSSLPGLLQLLAQPDLTASSGKTDLKAHVVKKGETQTITGTLALDDLTGRVGSTEFNQFGTHVDLDVALTPDQAQINKLHGTLTQAGKPGGAFDVSGSCRLTNKAAQFTAQLTDFNQDGLRPFVEPALSGKKLVSIRINGNASIQYDPAGSSAIKAGLQVTNLVVNDPQHQIPATPLEAKLDLDTALQGKSVDIHQFQLTLTPTQRARNAVQLSGHVDMLQTNALQGNMKLTAGALDLTSYYDLFAGKKAPAAQGGAPATARAQTSAPAATTGAPNQEPAPIQLPVKSFTADASIGAIYLREVEITNLQTTIAITGSHIVVRPCQLAINGAPVKASIDTDVGVPGYKYDVEFGAQKIPLKPLVDTFQPERAGQVGGTLTASLQLKGAGTTGANLKKNLNGQFDVLSTNLNFAVVNIHSRVINDIVRTISLVPDLLHGNLANIRSGWTDQLNAAPIDVIAANGTAGNGIVTLQDAVVRSAAFEARVKNGTVTLDNILTNSAMNIPVSVSLSRTMAQRIGLAASGDDAYVALPDFYTEVGTIGVPKTHYNTAALLQFAAKVGLGIGGSIGNVGGNAAGGLLNGIGGILGGHQNAPNTNAPNAQTNQPPNNKSPLNLLNRVLPK